jgi:hypothetical protein
LAECESPTMPRWTDRDEEWDNDAGFDEEADEFDDSEDEETTIPCPYCHRDIHEDAQRCPYCEHYISEEDSPPVRKPWWIILGVVVCLYVVFRWMF